MKLFTVCVKLSIILPRVHLDLKVLDLSQNLLNSGYWTHLWGAVEIWLVTIWSDIKGTLCLSAEGGVWDQSMCVGSHFLNFNFPLIRVVLLKWDQRTLKLVGGDLQSVPGLRQWCGYFLFTPLWPFSFSFYSVILPNKTQRIKETLRKWAQSQSSYLWSYLAVWDSNRLWFSLCSLGRLHVTFVLSSLLVLSSVTGDVTLSVHNLTTNLSIILFGGQSTAIYVSTITAAFMHLPQETGQLRPAVSCQLETQ